MIKRRMNTSAFLGFHFPKLVNYDKMIETVNFTRGKSAYAEIRDERLNMWRYVRCSQVIGLNEN